MATSTISSNSRIVKRSYLLNGGTTSLSLTDTAGALYLIITGKNTSDNNDNSSLYMIIQNTNGNFVVRTLIENDMAKFSFYFEGNTMTISNDVNGRVYYSIIPLF